MALFSRAKGANGHKMYCPYAVNRHLVQQTTYEYNDDNYQTLQQTIEHNTAELWSAKRNYAAHGTMGSAITTKLIEATIRVFRTVAFFHTIFAVAGVKQADSRGRNPHINKAYAEKGSI